MQKGGTFGLIQPIKFMQFMLMAKYLRDYLVRANTALNRIVDISQCSNVFPDPTTYPCLPIIKKGTPSSDHKILVVRVPPEVTRANQR